jgi:hypothetical protein
MTLLSPHIEFWSYSLEPPCLNAVLSLYDFKYLIF